MGHIIADANANLNEVLGVEAGTTLGELRETIERAGMDAEHKISVGMTKAAYLEACMQDAIVEDKDFDLMIMGRSHGGTENGTGKRRPDHQPGSGWNP